MRAPLIIFINEIGIKTTGCTSVFVSKICYMRETKKGTEIYLSDGTKIKADESIDQINDDIFKESGELNNANQ